MGNFDVDCNACKFNLIRNTAQVIELERLEQNDSENLRDEIESPNVVRALRPASTASSETQTARRRDARRTQDGRHRTQTWRKTDTHEKLQPTAVFTNHWSFSATNDYSWPGICNIWAHMASSGNPHKIKNSDCNIFVNRVACKGEIMLPSSFFSTALPLVELYSESVDRFWKWLT